MAPASNIAPLYSTDNNQLEDACANGGQPMTIRLVFVQGPTLQALSSRTSSSYSLCLFLAPCSLYFGLSTVPWIC